MPDTPPGLPPIRSIRGAFRPTTGRYEDGLTEFHIEYPVVDHAATTAVVVFGTIHALLPFPLCVFFLSVLTLAGGGYRVGAADTFHVVIVSSSGLGIPT